MKTATLKNLTSTAALAAELGVTPQRVSQLAKAAGVEGVTVGTARLFNREEVKRIIAVPRRSYRKSKKLLSRG